MFRVFTLLVLLAVSVLAEDEMIQKCGKFFHSGLVNCCKRHLPDPPADFMAIMRECHTLPDKPPSCERDYCVALRRGQITPDGKIDKSKIKGIIEKDFEALPDLLKASLKSCGEGDISKYGPPDMCESSKYRHCVEVQLVKTCPEWSNEGKCEGITDLVEECKKAE